MQSDFQVSIFEGINFEFLQTMEKSVTVNDSSNHAMTREMEVLFKMGYERILLNI